MSASGIPSAPGSPSSRKRKYDQLEQPPPPLPPDGSVLYVELHARPPPERRGRGGELMDYRWAFLLTPDVEISTRGRRYLVREIDVGVDYGGGAGSSREIGIMGLGIMGLEQQRTHSEGISATQPSENDEDAQLSRAWKLEIEDIGSHSFSDAHVRLQLPRVWDVEAFEAMMKDAFFESGGTRGVEWTEDRWMAGVFGKWRLVGWEVVQETMMDFLKVQEDTGRFGPGNSSFRVPTWDLLEGKQVVS